MGKFITMGYILGIYLFFRELGKYPIDTVMKYGLPVVASSVILNLTREKTLGEKLIAKVF